jgi:hypothetical protein
LFVGEGWSSEVIVTSLQVTAELLLNAQTAAVAQKKEKGKGEVGLVLTTLVKFVELELSSANPRPPTDPLLVGIFTLIKVAVLNSGNAALEPELIRKLFEICGRILFSFLFRFFFVFFRFFPLFAFNA